MCNVDLLMMSGLMCGKMGEGYTCDGIAFSLLFIFPWGVCVIVWCVNFLSTLFTNVKYKQCLKLSKLMMEMIVIVMFRETEIAMHVNWRTRIGNSNSVFVNSCARHSNSCGPSKFYGATRMGTDHWIGLRAVVIVRWGRIQNHVNIWPPIVCVL